jgi:hypothetical protein
VQNSNLLDRCFLLSSKIGAYAAKCRSPSGIHRITDHPPNHCGHANHRRLLIEAPSWSFQPVIIIEDLPPSASRRLILRAANKAVPTRSKVWTLHKIKVLSQPVPYFYYCYFLARFLYLFDLAPALFLFFIFLSNYLFIYSFILNWPSRTTQLSVSSRQVWHVFNYSGYITVSDKSYLHQVSCICFMHASQWRLRSIGFVHHLLYKEPGRRYMLEKLTRANK